MIPLDVELLRAGPGTGKTYQLAQRFAGLVVDAGHDPAQIAAVTFTRAAAAELRERVRLALDERGAPVDVRARVDDAPLLTIDAFSNWILRMSEAHRFVTTTPVSALLGAGSRRRRAQRWLVDQGGPTVVAVQRLLAAGVPYGDPGFDNPHLEQLVEEIVEYPSRCRSEDWLDIGEEGAPRWPELRGGDLRAVIDAAAGFSAHESWERLESGETSYDDTTALAVEFVESTEGATAIRANLSALLVDELQDTDPLQELLFSAIWSIDGADGAPAVHRFMVGDLKQAIYQFRNADPRVMERFVASTPAERSAALTVNRRSPQRIIDVLNAVGAGWFPDEPALEPIDAERDGAVVVLGAAGEVDPSDPRRSVRVDEVREREAAEVAAFLARERSRWERGSCALLVPTRTAMRFLETALGQAGVPVLNLASAPYDTAEVQEARVLLAAIADPANAAALIGALRGPAFALDDLTLAAAITDAKPNHLAQLSAAPQTVAAMEVLASLRADALELSVGPLVERAFEVTGLWDLAEASPTWTNRLHWVVTQALEFDRQSGGSLGRFLLHLEALSGGERHLSEQIVPAVGEPVVQLMTMHNAKGLQFDTVVVAGLLKRGNWKPKLGRWVHEPLSGEWRLRVNLGRDDADDFARQIEQQRRLLYVAMSRARTNLVVAQYHPAVETRSVREDDPSALLRAALIGVASDDTLVDVVPADDQLEIAERLPSPLHVAPQPTSRTVTSVVGEVQLAGGGRGREHGDLVHGAVAWALGCYAVELGLGVDDLVTRLDELALIDAALADAQSILRLPTIADAVASAERLEPEYPVAGEIDGEPVYGVADVVIFKSDGSVIVGDIKTDHTGETDPTGTPYEAQLDLYARLIASGTGASVSSVLLGPTGVADPNEWGDLAADTDRHGHELAQPLDAEDAAHGRE